MKTTINKTIVAFHIGRGGHFHNAGHLFYLGERSINEFTGDLFEGYENQLDAFKAIANRENLLERYYNATSGDEKAIEFLSKIGLDLGEKIYTDGGGWQVGLTVAEAETGIGTINIDHEYDTTYCQYLEDCNEKELFLILKKEESFYENNEMIEYIKEILS